MFDEYCTFAIDLAKEAGIVFKKGFYELKKVSTKCSVADLVTETDQEVENIIRKKIHEKYPTHSFIGEESISNGEHCVFTENPTWLVDPVDGTSNFVNNFPSCCISIGFYIQREACAAVIYNPITDELYHATKNGGAFLNGERIHVSTLTDLKESLILTDWGNDRTEEILQAKMHNFANLIPGIRGFRTMGSAALHMCYIARGCGEAFFEFGIHCWDYAAGLLMVQEAGGVVLAVDGGPCDLMARSVVSACCPTIAAQIIQILKNVPYPRD